MDKANHIKKLYMKRAVVVAILLQNQRRKKFQNCRYIQNWQKIDLWPRFWPPRTFFKTYVFETYHCMYFHPFFLKEKHHKTDPHTVCCVIYTYFRHKNNSFSKVFVLPIFAQKTHKDVQKPDSFNTGYILMLISFDFSKNNCR